jgi:hypothetical protein
MIMQRVVSVRPLEDFRLSITFDDGTQGEVAVGDRLFGPVFEPLRDPTLFRQVFVDDFGAIAWPNGADFAPDTIYARLRASAEVTAT